MTHNDKQCQTDPIVEISDVVPDTQRVVVSDVHIGDVVFDIFGGEHVVTRVTTFAQHTRITRDDGEVSTWRNDATMTIKRWR